MRGTVAKMLRKQADVTATSPTTEHETLFERLVHVFTGSKTEQRKVVHKTVFYTGYRRVYQDLKRAYYKGKKCSVC